MSALHRAITPLFFFPFPLLCFVSGFSVLCSCFFFFLFCFFPYCLRHCVFLSLPRCMFPSVSNILCLSPIFFLSLSLVQSHCRLLPLIEQQPLNWLTLQSLNNNLVPSIPPSLPVCVSEALPVHLTTLFQPPIHGAQITQGAVMTAHLLINCMCNC